LGLGRNCINFITTCIVVYHFVAQCKGVGTQGVNAHYANFILNILGGVVFTGYTQVVQIVASAQAVGVLVGTNTVIVGINREGQFQTIQLIHGGQLVRVRLGG